MENKHKANEIEVQNSKTSQKQDTIEYVEDPEVKSKSALNNNEIVPINHKKSVLNRTKNRHYPSSRRYIKRVAIQELCERKYQVNGNGITVIDIQNELRLRKGPAQRLLKYLHSQKFLFTAVDLIREGIILRGFKRSKPQIYYLTRLKTKIINRHEKNILNHTTDMSILQMQKVQYLHDQLVMLSDIMLHIHKLQFKRKYDKSYFTEIDSIIKGAMKVHYERINQSGGNPNIKYYTYKNGTIMIYVVCSDKPFRLHTEDITYIISFLGMVEDRLRRLFTSKEPNILPPACHWILKCCDVNKDIEIDSMCQLTLNNMDVPLVEKAFRMYVKTIGNKSFLDSNFA